MENRSRTETKKGAIQQQAGRHIHVEAGESIHIEAGQDHQIISGKLFQQSDVDAGLLYAGSAVTIAAGSVATTIAAEMALTGTAVLVGIGPIGWFVLGVVLIGGSMVLSRAGDAAQDSVIEKWLDACSFGMRALPGMPHYNNLDEEVTALSIALHNPQLVESDWSSRLGFDHYQAEAEVFLPGYDFGDSFLHITANGQSVAPVEHNRQDSGTLITLRYYLSKKEGIESVTFKIRYRPNSSFNKDFTLTITVPEPDETEINGQTISGP